jgi:signal transduction histidine kinase
VESARPRPWPILPVLALCSGAGLCVLVGLSLLRAAEQGRARAELDARKGAAAMAQALRAALQSPSVLDLVGAELRFEVREGALQVPDDVGWLDALPAPPPDPLLDDKMARTQQLEFVQELPAEAAAGYDELLGERGPRGDAGLSLLAAAAWHAHRSGDLERREVLRSRLHEALAEATPERCRSAPFASATASAALLVAATADPLPPWTARLLPALPPRLGGTVLRRMAEYGLDVADLVAARSHLARGPESGPSAAGSHVLLWFPEAGSGAGRGALCDPSALAQGLTATSARGLPPVPDLADSQFGAARPAGAEPLVPGLWWAVPRVPAEPGLLARPAAVAAAAAALALVFLGSAFLGFRALRRETAALAARAEFLTMVTHELKTPLASIRLLSEMLAEGRVPEGKEREYFGLLAGEAARLTMLIENVLDLGRMERGERAYDLRECDLGQVVREAVAVFAPLARRDGIALELRAAETAAPARGIADRGALMQALLNVLDNGRKYAAAGGRIEVDAAVHDGALRVAVRDFGPGVPEAEREQVFGRFARGAAHKNGAVPGVGLGLHLARAIVLRHGGALRCEAPEDGGPGARFTFMLPLREPGAGEAFP